MELSFDLAFSKQQTSSNIHTDKNKNNNNNNTNNTNVNHHNQNINNAIITSNNQTNTKHRKRKRKKKKSSGPSQIVVGNYSSTFDTSLLVNYFEDYCGNVKSFDFGYTLGTVNFGFITFKNPKSVEKASVLNNTVIYGETISVTVQIQNKTKTSKTEVSNKLV